MNRILQSLDWNLLIPVFILLIISLVTLGSLNRLFFSYQLALFILSFIIFIFFTQTDLRILKIYQKFFYIFSLIILGLVLILGIESRGAVRWIEFLGFRLQFSEFLKPFLAISLAAYLSGIERLNFRNFANVFIFLTPLFFLIFLQPDLGNAVIYFLVVLMTIFYAGFSIKYFIFSALPFLITFPLLWKLLHEYQKQRILTFLNPSSDPLGKSYNIIQSIIAVGSGMLIGKGIGQGTQSGLRFLPERQTDFIFATISEQLGLIGVIIVLVCFALILYRILQIFFNSDDKFIKFFCAITFFIFLIQIFVNIGMNLGILPIVGVTLPFVSYGGSSLLSNFIFLGLLCSIGKDATKNRVLEIK